MLNHGPDSGGRSGANPRGTDHPSGALGCDSASGHLGASGPFAPAARDGSQGRSQRQEGVSSTHFSPNRVLHRLPLRELRGHGEPPPPAEPCPARLRPSRAIQQSPRLAQAQGRGTPGCRRPLNRHPCPGGRSTGRCRLQLQEPPFGQYGRQPGPGIVVLGHGNPGYLASAKDAMQRARRKLDRKLIRNSRPRSTTSPRS